MKASWMLGLLLGSVALASCGVTRDVSNKSNNGRVPTAIGDDEDDDDGDDDDDQVVALDQVPELVKQAALAAVPGLVIEVAEKEKEHGVELYSLAGTAAGETVEVEVSTDGKVLEIERGGDDEDD